MTSRFAPVAPVSVHQRLLEAGALGDYHLLLAHQVLTQPGIHKGFYKEQLPNTFVKSQNGSKYGQKPRTPYIIMDNSLIELGYPLSVRDVLEAAEMVNASVIVLPDVLGDRVQTLYLAAKAAEELHELRAHSPYARRVKMLGVAQGQTLNDVFSCGRDLIQQVGVDVVSVPRHVVSKVGSRIEVTRLIAQYGKPIHLLGFSDNIFDDMWTLRIPRVMGIDSAVPIWYGLQGFELPSEPPVVADFGKRPKDYESQTEINSKVIQNIKRVERWASTAKVAPTRR